VGYGCGMYIGTKQAFIGKPDLSNYQYICDKIEMGSIRNRASWNTTCVDFVGVPMQVEVNGVKVGFLDGITRQHVLEVLEAIQEDPYPHLSYAPGGTTLRFFSLIKLPSPHPLNDCFGAAISTGLPLLAEAAEGVTISYGESTYSDIQWHEESKELTANSGSGPVTISNIDTEHAVGNTITFSDGGTDLAGMIGAAVHRGVLYDPTLWGSFESGNPGYPGNYYHENPSNGEQFDRYAEILHSLSIDSICYAQSYDDIFHQDPSLIPAAGNTVIITILPAD